MSEIKTGYVHEDFTKDREKSKFIDYSNHSKYYCDTNRFVAQKIKNEIACVPIKEFVVIKPKSIFFDR